MDHRTVTGVTRPIGTNAAFQLVQQLIVFLLTYHCRHCFLRQYLPASLCGFDTLPFHLTMPLQISIVPLESTLDIYGPPDTTAAYSLAGHVSLSFSSRLSIFDRGRSEKLLLHSLELTFEGQSELVSDGGGYSAARVCSITKELIDGEPLLISNEDELASLDTKKTPSPRWDVVFNIPIPGWLPATSAFGQFFNDMESGTKYTLYAKATFRDLNAAKSPTLPTLLCGLFRPYSRTMRSTPCPIIIRRLYISPCRSECALDEVQPFPRTTYTVKTSVKRAMDREFADHELIPVDVLAGIDIKVDIPESLSVFEDVPVTLSTRLSPALTEDQRRRVGLVGFKMDIQQAETYTYATHLPFCLRLTIDVVRILAKHTSHAFPSLPNLANLLMSHFYPLVHWISILLWVFSDLRKKVLRRRWNILSSTRRWRPGRLRSTIRPHSAALVGIGPPIRLISISIRKLRERRTASLKIKPILEDSA
jgi:hypothetical protein